MKKNFLKALLVGATLLSSITGCNSDEDCGCKIDTLEEVNALLNDNESMNMALANAVAVIPFHHINGPRNEWAFYALINFQYKAFNYVKYQVTYLSCTCRTADVNYWQTAYVELSLPGEGESADTSYLKKLSFDADGTGHYTAGFWGDSSPIYDEGTGQAVAVYDHENCDAQYSSLPAIKQDYIPLLIGKTKADFDRWSTTDDMTELEIGGKSISQVFSGASVSTNNIIRILKALFEYHAETFCNSAE